MNALHISTMWRRLRSIIDDTSYVTARLTDFRVPVRH